MLNGKILFVLVFLSASVYGQFIAEGVGLVPLTTDGKSSAIGWAPHGNKILYKLSHTTDQHQLFISNSDGTEAQAITEMGHIYYAEWSWAGDKVAYLSANSAGTESQSSAFIYDLNTRQTLTASAPYPRLNLDEDEGPVWSPDDRYVAFKTRTGPSRTRFITLFDTQTKTNWSLLPQRGQCRLPSWNKTLPARLTFLTVASEEYYDVGISTPEGNEFIPITAIGAEAITNWQPKWRPPCSSQELIAYTSNKELTPTERSIKRNDVWVASPDGKFTKNLTQSTSPSTERQLNNDIILWSWDGRWILSRGDRFDAQGRDIHTAYLMDPENGGYKTIFTTYPEKTGQTERVKTIRWSYDSKKILLLTTRYTVVNWNSKPEYQKPIDVISLLDVETGQRDELLVIEEELELKMLMGGDSRADIENITFSPNGRSILLTVAAVISREEALYRPDVYRLDLPDNLIGPQAALYDGPPMGRPASANNTKAESPADTQTLPPQPQTATPESSSTAPTVNDKGELTELVSPEHTTVEEIMTSLPGKYAAYLTKNPSRNILLFKGPPAIFEELKQDMHKVDTIPPQILVDLLAVELSDEANRSLGLDWTYADGHFGLFQPQGNAIRDLTPDATQEGINTFPGQGQMFFNGVDTLPREFFIRLNSFIQDGKGTILANPRTVAMSGKESVIQIRRTLNYFFNEGYDTAGRPIVKKSDISSDTQGRITPTLLSDGRIHLLVDVKVGSFTFTSDAGLPEQTQRDSTTTVTVSENQTLVIGGLRQQEMVQTVIKTPILGDLPLVGFLFQKQQRDVTNSVLTLFITPRILKEGQPDPQWPEMTENQLQMQTIMNKEQLDILLKPKKEIHPLKNMIETQ